MHCLIYHFERIKRMNKIPKQTPRFARWLITKSTKFENRSTVIGDFEEEYKENTEAKGVLKAVMLYWFQALLSLPKLITNSVIWNGIMFRNYLKIAIRTIKKQKIYSVVTISGLVFGFGIFIFFAQTFNTFTNANKFHKNIHKLYPIVQVTSSGNEGDQHSTNTPPPLLPALLRKFPEIKNGTRLPPAERIIVKYEDRVFYETGALFADPNFFTMFSFDMVNGNPETVLSERYSVVLTEASALKYFGDENPIGKSLIIDNKIGVTITGIVKKIPRNSSIRFDFLISMDTAKALYDWMNDWTVTNQTTFILLQNEYDRTQLEEKFASFIPKYYPESATTPVRIYAFPFSEFYLNARGINTSLDKTHPVVPYLSLVIGMIVLLVVCINYINLSTARHVLRAKEVGMRKVIGAHRFNLIKQFLGESVLMSILAFPASVVFYEFIRSIMIMLGSSDRGALWDNPVKLLVYLGIFVFIGILAGTYPAFFLSAFKPVKVLKEEIKSGKKGTRFRKIQVVFQFSLTIIFITLTIVMGRMSDHLLKIDLGFNRKNVMIVPLAGTDRSNFEPMKKELSRHKDVLSISASVSVPVDWNTERQVLPEGINENEPWTITTYGIDYGFVELLELEIIQGRSFSREFNDDNNFILNETAVRQLQWKKPLGKQLTMGNRKGTVIGITKDFHFHDIDSPFPPVVLYLEKENLNYMLIKYSSPENKEEVLNYIKRQWSLFEPDLPFEYTTIEYYYQDMSEAVKKGMGMLGTVGTIAIFYSCLGLLGLVAYSVEQRTKEIGLRKILGSSVSGIIQMLMKEFVFLVAISNSIGLPLAYFITRYLLQSGTFYPLEIGTGVYLFVSGISLMVTIIAVASQTVKAALANPIDSLRYE